MPYYKKDIEETLERCRILNEPGSTGALLHLWSIDEITDRVHIPPVASLKSWNFDTQLHDYLDEQLKILDLVWSHRSDVNDDFIPSLYPRFGVAEHSAFMGGEVAMEDITSYHVPFIKKPEDLDDLHFHEDSKWLHRVTDGMRYIQEKGHGRIAVRLRGVQDAGDMANAIRGNDLFTDFYDDPEWVHRMFSICCEGGLRYLQRQLDVYEGFYGGVIDGNGIFVPQGTVGHLSQDWTCMCSPSFYKDFGRPYVDRLLEPFSGCELHFHGAAKHAIPLAAASDKITHIQLVRDPNQPIPIALFRQYEKELAGKVVILMDTLEEIESNLDFLQDKRIIIETDVTTFAQAQRAVELVRSCLAVHPAHRTSAT